jgi:hypothetical protein
MKQKVHLCLEHVDAVAGDLDEYIDWELGDQLEITVVALEDCDICADLGGQ